MKPLFSLGKCVVGPFLPAEVETATSFLDAGAACVYFDVAVADSSIVVAVAEALSALPRDRLGIFVRTAADGAAAAIAALREMVGTVLVAVPDVGVSKSWCDSMLAAAGVPRPQLIVVPSAGEGCGGGDVGGSGSGSRPSVTPDDVGRLHRLELHVACPAATHPPVEGLLVDGSTSNGGALPSAADVGECLAACARTDRPDGLLATIVADEHGKALGLVYSSKESIVEAIRCGRGVYYSRSR